LLEFDRNSKKFAEQGYHRVVGYTKNNGDRITTAGQEEVDIPTLFKTRSKRYSSVPLLYGRKPAIATKTSTTSYRSTSGTSYPSSLTKARYCHSDRRVETAATKDDSTYPAHRALARATNSSSSLNPTSFSSTTTRSPHRPPNAPLPRQTPNNALEHLPSALANLFPIPRMPA
jgi:hypothetical protein